MAVDKDIMDEVRKLVEDVLKTKSDSILFNLGDRIRSLKDEMEEYSSFETDNMVKSLDALKQKKQEIIDLQEKEAKALEANDQDAAKDFRSKIESKQKLAEIDEEKFNEERKALKDSIEGTTKLDKWAKSFNNKTRAISKGFSEISAGAKQIGGAVKDMLSPWTKASQAAANYAKAVGMSGKAMDALLKTTANAAVKGKIGINFNYSTDELLKLQSNYVQDLGRNIGVSDKGVANLAATSRVMGEDNAKNLFAQLDNFGLSLNDASELAGKMYAKASKSGISMEKYSKNFLSNIKMAQTYTFKDGLAGLERMAKKATEMKLEMSQVSSFANKVNSVEGAITTGAKLQVLGGTFTQFANPLQMLYEGTSNVEGLMDRMTNMFGNLGTFNKNTGQVEINGFNRLRIQQASEAMGLDYANVMESITNKGRRNEIAKQANGRGFSDEMLELLQNVGTIEKGKAGVNINGQFRSVNQLTNNDLKTLKDLNKTESEDIKEIAISVRGMEEVLTGSKKERENRQVKITNGIGQNVKKLVNKVANIGWLMNTLVAASIAKSTVQAVKGAGEMAKGSARVLKGLGKLFKGSAKTGGGQGVGAASKIFKLLGKGGWVGLAIAAIAGATIAIRAGLKKKWEKTIKEKTGVELQGKYKLEGTKKIGQAVSDGKMSYYEFRQLPKNLQKKMIESGDAERLGIHAAHGGYISGRGSATSDSIHAMLSNGESVMSAAATDRYAPILSAMNQSVGGAPIVPRKFSKGGTVGVLAPNPTQMINTSMGNGNLAVNYGGEVNVRFPNGLSKNLEREFLNDNQFIDSMVKMVSEGVNRRNQGGAYKVTKAFSNMR